MTADYQGPTPPQWQVDAWHKEALAMGADVDAVLLKAYRAGADQELEACCEWVENECPGYGGPYKKLRAARRPKPPSLAEQALAELEKEDDSMPLMSLKRGERFALIRRALERLQELESGDD